MSNKRNRIPSLYIESSMYLYFLGLSTRSVSKVMFFLHKVKRSHDPIWKWIQKYKPQLMKTKQRRQITEFILDETLLKVGSELIWLWVVIESENRQIFALNIIRERNMLITERFLSGVVRGYGKHPVSTDGGGTWYPTACQFLKLDHHIHSPWEKSIVERKIQYVKDRTESFDDYFSCKHKNCKLKQVRNWLNMFLNYHNKEIIFA